MDVSIVAPSVVKNMQDSHRIMIKNLYSNLFRPHDVVLQTLQAACLSAYDAFDMIVAQASRKEATAARRAVSTPADGPSRLLFAP